MCCLAMPQLQTPGSIMSSGYSEHCSLCVHLPFPHSSSVSSQKYARNYMYVNGALQWPDVLPVVYIHLVDIIAGVIFRSIMTQVTMKLLLRNE